MIIRTRRLKLTGLRFAMGALNGGGLQLKTILGLFSAFFVFRKDIFYFKEE